MTQTRLFPLTEEGACAASLAQVSQLGTSPSRLAVQNYLFFYSMAVKEKIRL